MKWTNHEPNYIKNQLNFLITLNIIVNLNCSFVRKHYGIHPSKSVYHIYLIIKEENDVTSYFLSHTLEKKKCHNQI